MRRTGELGEGGLTNAYCMSYIVQRKMARGTLGRFFDNLKRRRVNPVKWVKTWHRAGEEKTCRVQGARCQDCRNRTQGTKGMGLEVGSPGLV